MSCVVRLFRPAFNKVGGAWGGEEKAGIESNMSSSDLRKRLFHSHMGLGSGSTNSSGVGSGEGSRVRAYILSGIDFGVDFLFVC
jgi:hypothetical protein